MKKILLMFLIGTMTMFSQTIKVRGVVLSYDKVKKVMTLTTTPKIMTTNDIHSEVKIVINREFALSMTIGGVNYSITEPFFEHSGHVREMGWSFSSYKPRGCKEIKNNYVFQFTNVEPGEYILTVSDVCDNKYVTNEQTMSIQIN
jgi:hypothetical protein